MPHFSELRNNTDPSWWKDGGMRKSVLHILILYTAVYSLGYDGSLLNGLQALPFWNSDFGTPTGTSLGLIAASYYLPKIPASPMVAWVIDRYGRKSALYIGAVLMTAGAIVGGFAYSTGQLIGSRVLLGLGTVAGQVGATAMVPELAHPRLRHFAGSFLLTTFYIGSILASWVTFAMVYVPTVQSWTWRIPTLIQGVGPLMLLVGTWFLPESPRWLIKKGRDEEAHRILATYHANGDMDDELVQFEMAEIRGAIEYEAKSDSIGWAAFFKVPSNRLRLASIVLIGLATQWAGNGVVQYYLVPILRTVGITAAPQTAGINGGLAIWNWFCALTGASLVERFGRRSLFLFSFSGMLASFCLILGLSGGYDASKIPSVGISMIPFIFVFMGFYSSALTPLPLLYVPEITPLALRGKAIASLTFTQNTAQAFNQFVNPVALAAIGWKYYGVYVALLTMFLVAFYLLIRETKGCTVEEAAMVYESPETRAATAARVTGETIDHGAALYSQDKGEDSPAQLEYVGDKRV